MRRATQRLQRRGRTIVLTTLGLFLAAQMVGGLLLDYRWPHLRYPDAWSRFAGLERGMKRVGASPTLVYLGSSRIQSDLNSQALTKHLSAMTGRSDIWAFDCSIKAADGTVMEFAFNNLLERGARPECVVIEVVPETLNRRQEYIGEHVVRMLRWEDTPTYFSEIVHTSNLPRLALARIVPLYTHRFELVKLIRQGARALGPKQEMPRMEQVAAAKDVVALPVSRQRPASPAVGPERDVPVTPQQREATGGGLGMIQRCLRNYQVGGRPCEALERLLVKCREHGCAVILLGVPVASRHRALYTPAIDQQYRAYLDHVQNAYGCRFVDYHDRLPDHLFIDNHHARSEGGRYFTRIFADEVLQHLGSKRVASND